MAKDNNTIITEIQEDLNRERMAQFFNAHGIYVYTLIVLVIVGIGAYEGWRYFDTERRTVQGDKLYSIISDFTPDVAPKDIQEVGKDRNYKDITKLIEANLYEQKKDEANVMKAYEELANDSSAEKPFRELAELNIISFKLNKNPADTSIEPSLKKLTAEDSIYKFTAMEMLASYYKTNGRNDKAKEIFAKLANDEKAPRSLAGRARSMLSSF